MKVDFRNDQKWSRMVTDRYNLIDMDTGRVLNGEPIVFADEERGIYRRLLKDPDGSFRIDPTDPNSLASELVHARIKFVPKTP